MAWKIKKVNREDVENYLIRESDGAFVPFNPENKDYQEYLKWTKASPMNVAKPADEVTE